MIKIGVDPGPNNGSIAVIATGAVDLWTIKEFSKTPYYDIDKLFKSIRHSAERNNEKIFCVIERQIPYVPKSAKIFPAASLGKLMEHYGLLKGLMISNKIPFQDPVPRSWMKLYNMKKEPSDTKTTWKNKLKSKAKQLEPHLHIISDNADAILIARVAHKFFE